MIYLPSSVSTKTTSTFSNNLFPAKQRIKTCIFMKTAASDAPKVTSVGLLPTNCEDVAMVALESMRQASSTLEDFCKSYFMFHDMDVNNAEFVFKYLPVLSFAESYMYQLDTINEKSVEMNPASGTSDFVFRKLAECLASYGLYTDRSGYHLMFPDPWKVSIYLLFCNNFRIRDELKGGEEYWVLERKLCGALTTEQKIQVEDVMKACHLRSTDYRILNLLLYQLNGKQVNEAHMEFLSASEFLAEIFQDFSHYEDDVLNNTFNILRMFVRIYGASSAPTMLEKLIREAEEKYSYLLCTLDPKLALQYKKRREEATKEGYKWIKSGRKELDSPFETWSMPPIIEDENLYRYEISNTWPPGTN